MKGMKTGGACGQQTAHTSHPHAVTYCMRAHQYWLAVISCGRVKCQELRLRIECAFQQIRNDSGFPERIRSSQQRREQRCVQMHGQHFEHLLQRHVYLFRDDIAAKQVVSDDVGMTDENVNTVLNYVI
ncbi:hypothetical protein ANN_15411 [Periplaneta americana]|uniref:Uncharacterized protein n=1 Tax=Periplaneta americana TaxID=6978 RepID=A0ABQ8SGB5_PERAM|nr:hypothetical protein ANN_15411 [Periplaneta americana]